MPDCFKMKTHPNLMKFKERNVYLWIKILNDLLLIVPKIVTVRLNKERKSKQRKAREKVLLCDSPDRQIKDSCFC
jgi:hypothetical protein